MPTGDRTYRVSLTLNIMLSSASYYSHRQRDHIRQIYGQLLETSEFLTVKFELVLKMFSLMNSV